MHKKSFTHEPESHAGKAVDEWLSVQGSAPPPKERNPVKREAAAVRQRSFTIIEAVIAVIIIAILASVTIPYCSYLMEKGIDGEANSTVIVIKIAEETYKKEKGHLVVIPFTKPPGNLTHLWNRIGLDNPNLDNKSEFWYGVTNIPKGSPQEYYVEARRKNPKARNDMDSYLYVIRYSSATNETSKSST